MQHNVTYGVRNTKDDKRLDKKNAIRKSKFIEHEKCFKLSGLNGRKKLCNVKTETMAKQGDRAKMLKSGTGYLK